MSAIHQDFRFHNWNQARFLAERGETGERMRVRIDAGPRSHGIADLDDGAPFAEARSQFIVLCKTLAQAVQTFGDLFIRRIGERARSLIYFDSGDNSLLPESFGKRRSVVCFLPDGLIEQDHTADEVAKAWSC